jgi:hypothetical protein
MCMPREGMSTNGDHSITRASTRTRSSSRVTRCVYARCQRAQRSAVHWIARRIPRSSCCSGSRNVALVLVCKFFLWSLQLLNAFSRPCRGSEGLGTRPDVFLDWDASCILVTRRPVLTSYGWTSQVQRIRRQSRARRDPRASCPTRTPGA